MMWSSLLKAQAGEATKPSGESDNESTGTVILAGAANLAIAIAKLFGGIISHSSAMLSEAAHSFADTVTEVRRRPRISTRSP